MIRISPSAIRAFERCPRLWYNQYILRAKEPMTETRLMGIKTHKTIERYLTGEQDTIEIKDPTLMEIIRTMRDHKVESELRMEHKERGITYVGVMDALHREHQIIYDFKMKKKLNKRYIPTEEQLLDDPGCVIYTWLCQRKYGWGASWATWIYIDETTHEYHPVTVTMSRGDVEERMKRIYAIADRMKEMVDGSDPIERNYDACYQFNRPCWMKKICHDEETQIKYINHTLERKRKK